MATKKTKSNAAAPHPKTHAIDALRAAIARDLAALEAAALAAHEAATHPEAKPENDKDTRALEAGYLAGAQSARAAEVKRALAELERAPSASFTLYTLCEQAAGKAQHSVVLLSPWGGGSKVVVDGVVVAVVSPHSPLGAALAGRRTGDVLELELGPRRRELEVLDIE
jgi:NADH dehydrogenase/NADH:ubiquinone oxidoreductase subunit G